MKKTYILALAALALAFSCQKTENSPEATSEPVMRTFTCTIADVVDPDTKVTIGTDGATTWKEGDEILFHGKYAGGSYSAVVTLESKDISNKGKTITVTVPDFTNGADQAKWAGSSASYSASNIIALYPASAADATMVDSGGSNWYNMNFFGETNLPLMSGFNDGYDSNSIIFYNLCGILSFVVTGDYDSYVLSGNNAEAVSYTKYTSRLYKKTDNSIITDWVYTASNKDFSTPLTSISGKVTSGEETRIFIPGGVTFSGGFTINFIKGGSIVKTLSTEESVSVPRNSYRPMGNVDKYLKDYKAPETHDSKIPTAGATELDATENANCYIVDGSEAASNAGKAFKFKAYKGNSSASVGTVASVDILWETWNNDEEVTAKSVIGNVDFEKKAENTYYTIVFQMPEKEKFHAGNAVIAAKDAGNNILWSWHIWVPDGMHADITDATIFGEKAIMSRNLGALVDAPANAVATVESYGLLYQWGRKDPFPGNKGLTTKGSASVSGVAMTSQDGTLTIEESIKNPTVFAKSNDDKDWVTEGENDNSLWSTKKTIYDPCPPGYIVPTRNTSAHYWSGTKLNELDAADNFVDNGSTCYSYQLGTSTPIVFPYAGYIQMKYGDQYKPGLRTYVWSSYASSYGGNVDVAYTVYARTEATAEYKRTEKGKCLGASVRCVAK